MFTFQSRGQLGKMQILLLFVLATATFGTCKKFHAKHDGYLIHTKSATYLKINKSHRKSKSKFTTHEVKPKEQGADYDDIDSLDTWKEQEKWLFDMWDDAWDRVKDYVEQENSKVQIAKLKSSKQPKAEAEPDPNSQEAKWTREWDILVDTILGTTSTNEADYTEKDMKLKQLKRKAEDRVLDEAAFFIRPKHRRRGLKWIQSTVETDKVFLAHKIEADVEESLYIEMAERKGKIVDKSCNETYRCFMTTQATTMTTATSLSFTSTTYQPRALGTQGGVPPSAIGNPNIGKIMKAFKGSFLRHHLKKVHKPSNNDYEQGGVPSYDDIVCDPSDR